MNSSPSRVSTERAQGEPNLVTTDSQESRRKLWISVAFAIDSSTILRSWLPRSRLLYVICCSRDAVSIFEKKIIYRY